MSVFLAAPFIYCIPYGPSAQNSSGPLIYREFSKTQSKWMVSTSLLSKGLPIARRGHPFSSIQDLPPTQNLIFKKTKDQETQSHPFLTCVTSLYLPTTYFKNDDKERESYNNHSSFSFQYYSVSSCVHIKKLNKTVDLFLCSISTVLVRSKYAYMSYKNMNCAILVILHEANTLTLAFKIGIVQYDLFNSC